MAILQALIDESARRGYGTALGRGDVVLAIVIGEDRYEFELFEEHDIVPVVSDEEIASKRFAWQRVIARPESRPSGRLVLRLQRGHRQQTWADRTRWRLADRLGHALAYIESDAQEADARRRSRREQALRDRAAWEAALDEARRSYIEALNGRRMDDQRAAWERATGLRAYAEGLSKTLVGAGPEQTTSMDDWRRQILAEADRVDPFNAPDELRWVVPDDIGPDDLQPYMPRGTNARRPPEIPD